MIKHLIFFLCWTTFANYVSAQETNDLFNKAQALYLKADSFRYSDSDSLKKYLVAASNLYDQCIKSNVMKNEACYFLGKILKYPLDVGITKEFNPPPAYTYFNFLYELISKNPSYKLSSYFSNRRIYFELYNLSKKRNLLRASSYLIKALEIQDGKNEYDIRDEDLQKKLGFTYFEIAKGENEIKNYFNASFYYSEAEKYFRISSQSSETNDPSGIMRKDAEKKSIICNFLFNNSRWKPLMHQVPNLFESELLWNDYLYVYDPETIKFTKDNCKVWIRGIRLFNKDDNDKLYEIKSFINFNLKTRKFQATKVYLYDKKLINYDYAENENPPWHDIIPESLDEALLNGILKIKPKK